MVQITTYTLKLKNSLEKRDTSCHAIHHKKGFFEKGIFPVECYLY